MGKISKTLALFLILIIAFSCLSLLIVKPANAQTTPALTIPQFTVSFVNRSYTTPIITTQTTDPFTGQQVTQTSGGQYVENDTIVVTITNPSYTQVVLANGTEAQLFFSVRAKGHFVDWSDNVGTDGCYSKQLYASASNYTVLTIIITSDIQMNPTDIYLPQGGQEDFQVEANAGYLGFLYTNAGMFRVFNSYADSGWSNTQTLTIPTDSNSVVGTSTTSTPEATQSRTITQTPATSAPSVPELSWLVIVPLLLYVFSVAVIVRNRKTTNLKQ